MGIMALCRLFNPGPVLQKGAKEKHLAEMEKKVALMLAAMARPISVLPVPGGPKSSRPLGGARAPCAASTPGS